MYQELYLKDKSSLSGLIIQGLDPGLPPVAPTAADITSHYREVFAGAAPQDAAAIMDRKEPTQDLYLPFLEASVRASISDRRVSNAAGPDGMTAAALRGLHLRGITVLFNAFLFAGYIPSSLKAARTTLIPKGGANLADVSSWRPITVTSVLVRTLHHLLAARMSTLPLHPSQRGFRSLDGTLSNSILLQTAIKTCRSLSRPYAVVSLDLRKAFDTVPHSSVRRALERFSVHPKVSKFILDGLTDCHTTISAGTSKTDQIPILRGVKQGDPLSPLLFNLVLDELLCSLDQMPTGLLVGDSRVSVMAYADDLLLLTPSPADMCALLYKAVTFFEARNMELNPTKCSSVTVKLLPSRKKLYLSAHSIYTIRGTPLPRTEAENTFKYLGHRYGYMGTDLPSTDSLKAALANLQRAPLKPHQKLVLLQDYLIPKYLYSFQSPRVNSTILDRADKAIRRFVKENLHIPIQTANALLYAELRDGGLGCMCLSARIPDILMGRLSRLRTTLRPLPLGQTRPTHSPLRTGP